VAEDPAALHDEADVLGDLDVGRGIAGHRDKVGEVAGRW
jgi:hypothetical protein